MKLLGKASCFALQIATVTFTAPAFAETVNITLLQLNDIYEITPVAGGTRGGLARVATIRQQLLQQNPHTYTILAGDAFSPSALGTAKVNGKPLAGQQMVAVMNAIGFNYATFGNHEFDLPQDLFLERLKESRFTWFSGNVSDGKKQPFPNVPRSVVFNVKGEGGAVVRVGLIGVTLGSNHANYVTYTDPLTTAQAEVKALQGKADIVVAVTHLPLEQDQKLVEAIPEIKLIIGGHEHENIQQWRGQNFTPIFKADANARTVYIHNLAYNTETHDLKINSHLQPVTDAIPDEPNTAKVVKEWVDRGFQAFLANGFNPEEIIGETTLTLDGLETSVRNQSTTLTELIAQAMLTEVPEAELAILNGGAIRIDDTIPPGKITQYDVIRMLPFGGKIVSVEMRGELLQRVLNQGKANQGTGGYLQTANVKQNAANQWLINGQLLTPTKIYRVAINDFLISGQEQGLDFLNLQQPGIKLISEKRDIRMAVIAQIKHLPKSSSRSLRWNLPSPLSFLKFDAFLKTGFQ
ncbi:MAG: bifunctional metallophosphatase/5'-nucleotidase [Actinomycetota bacterium]